MKASLVGAVLVSAICAANSADHSLHTFKKLHLSDKFWAEGAHYGDFNKDGKMDVVYGPHWFEGPSFTKRHEYAPATKTFKLKKPDGTEETIEGYEGGLGTNNAYSDNFIAHTHDINGDGWTDILILGFPGDVSCWYENPKGKPGHWIRRVAIEVTDNESPTFTDITGDGRPEIVCSSKGFYGYATPDRSDPTKLWTFHPISPDKKYHKFTHGLGVGDVNGDGRKDLLEKDGWWEQPASLSGDPQWAFHPYKFGLGGAQMHAYDVNGDGLNDVITSLVAHGYGLAWFEQYREGAEIKFREHVFMNKEPGENRYGIQFSQLHAIDLVDMDGDGLKDILTGKRFWAHGRTGDPDPNGKAVLYWFKLVRNKDKTVDFIPHLIDDNSGTGTQVLAGDLNKDGLPDVVVGNKKGTFVFLHEKRKVGKDEWMAAQPKAIH